MKTARHVAILVLVALALVAFGPQAAPSADKTVIRIASPFKPGTILVDAAEKFKELVAQGSGGRIDVQIDAGTKSEEAISKANRTGEIEMQSNGTMFLQDYAPPYYFFTGPYVMKDFEHYMRVWNGKLGQAARAQLEKNDLKYLATIYRGLRQMTTRKPPPPAPVSLTPVAPASSARLTARSIWSFDTPEASFRLASQLSRTAGPIASTSPSRSRSAAKPARSRRRSLGVFPESRLSNLPASAMRRRS